MKNCPTCKQDFTRKWPYQLRKAIYCSHKCANKHIWDRVPFTEEHKSKLEQARNNFVYSDKLKAKMSQIKKAQFADGQKTWNKGKEMTQEYKDTISASLTGKVGPDSRNWKGGIAYFKIRAIRMRENGGSHTKGQWETSKAQYNWVCPCCKKPEPEIKLVKDHVIPIANGGSDNIQNIQPLCFSYNAKKHTTEIRYEVTQY